MKKKKEIKEEKRENIPNRYDLIPLWGWLLIFLLPLAFSEYMFYVAKRLFSIIAFPIAWVAFWLVIMYRSDWRIFKKGKRGQK